MRTLPEVQELIGEIERDLQKLEQPLADASEQYAMDAGRSTAACDAFIADYSGPGWKSKHAAAREHADLVEAAYRAKARLDKGKAILENKRLRLDALRSESASLKAEMEVLRTGYGT
jgi:chromosome segregation ATPase